MVYSYRKSAKEFESKITMSTEMTRQKALIDSIALPGGDWTLFAIFAFPRASFCKSSSNASAGKADRRKKVVHIYILQYTLRVEFPIDHRQGVLDEYVWLVCTLVVFSRKGSQRPPPKTSLFLSSSSSPNLRKSVEIWREQKKKASCWDAGTRGCSSGSMSHRILSRIFCNDVSFSIMWILIIIQ